MRRAGEAIDVVHAGAAQLWRSFGAASDAASELQPRRDAEPHRHLFQCTSLSGQRLTGDALSLQIHIAHHVLILHPEMTSQPLRAIPVHLQPNAKAAPTAQTVSLSVGANINEDSSRASSQARPSKRRQDAASVDFLSDAATLSLIRRVLSTQSASTSDQRSTPRPIEDLLPPLTSSNEVDVQLYAIIAIIVRDFVYTWYSKITPDQVFVEEVIQIIAHCSRALEQRLRRIDVDELVLDEIPAVISAHVQGQA